MLRNNQYRMRDIAEKAFWNYKDRLNLRRTLTSSESSLEGKLFVEFVALIYLSYINKKMIDGQLYSKYTMHELLDELDVIECYLELGKTLPQGEVLMKQEQLYRDFGVKYLLHNIITKNCRAKWRILHLQNGENCRGYSDHQAMKNPLQT